MHAYGDFLSFAHVEPQWAWAGKPCWCEALSCITMRSCPQCFSLLSLVRRWAHRQSADC